MAFHHRKLLPSVEVGPIKKPDAGDINPVKHRTTVIFLSLGVFGAAFLFLSYLAIRRYASRRRSSLPLETRSNREEFTDALQEPAIDHPIWYIRTIGLPQSVVDSIEMISYKRGDGLVETSDCSVCLSEFEEGDSLRLLPKCSHAFHVACIDTWLRSHTNCPLCRAPVRVSPAESSESGESRVESETEMIESSPVVSGVEDDREMEAVRRSLSLDFSSHLQHNKAFPINKSTSFSFSCSSL